MNKIQIYFFVAIILFFLCFIIVLDVVVKNNNIEYFHNLYHGHCNREWSLKSISLLRKETPFVTSMKSKKHILAFVITIFLANCLQTFIVSLNNNIWNKININILVIYNYSSLWSMSQFQDMVPYYQFFGFLSIKSLIFSVNYY